MATQISVIELGPAQMKPAVVEALIAAGLIAQPPNWEQQKYELIKTWLLDPQKTAELDFSDRLHRPYQLDLK